MICHFEDKLMLIATSCPTVWEASTHGEVAGQDSVLTKPKCVAWELSILNGILLWKVV